MHKGRIKRDKKRVTGVWYHERDLKVNNIVYYITRGETFVFFKIKLSALPIFPVKWNKEENTIQGFRVLTHFELNYIISPLQKKKKNFLRMEGTNEL